MTPPRKAARPEARRLLAADLFARGVSYIEVARTLVVSEEAARRWKLRFDAGGRDALKESAAAKRGPKPPMTDAQVHRLMKAASAAGLQTLNAIFALAQQRQVPGSIAALRRRLIALGYWPLVSVD